MAATIDPPETDGRPAAEGPRPALLRFDRVERAVHWVNGALFLLLLVTGGALYLQPLATLVGRRHLVEDIHVYAGLALPLPLLVAVSGRWGRALRADLRRFNRWSAADRRWLGALWAGAGRRAAVRVGKFNAGQKLNAAFVAGSGLVLLGTGVIMRWFHPWPLAWRTGATFVHDWLALAVAAVVVGHLAMAARDREALRSMVRGTVSRRWAARHARAWLDGEDGPPPPTR